MGARPERIVLIGLRRAGKTTVGGLVARRLGWTLIDTDEVVLKMTGRTPADWIRGAGIDAFRKAESAALGEIAGARHVVVAPGGGAPLSDENRLILRESALIAYLRVDPGILAERARVAGDEDVRPRLVGGHDEEPFILFAERDGLYRKFSDLVIDASRTPDVVATLVVNHFERL